MKLIEFDKKVVCNSEFVAVRIIDNQNELKVGNIYLPSTTHTNDRLGFGIIEDVGEKATEEYGIKVGDYVMFDRLSTFAHTAPVALLRYNNVICLTNKENNEFNPLKGMLFVIPDEKENVSKVGNIFVTDYKDKLNIGTIEKVNISNEKFLVGDKVMMTKGADVVQIGEKTIYIYKEDMLICKIED